MYSKLGVGGGGVNTGHIFLILPTSEFRQLKITSTLTAGITAPMVYTVSTLADNTTDTAYKQYLQALADHLLYHNTS